jgi:hypothetical protein
MFEVTRDWIMANRTERGGWTQDQLAQLEIDWPPYKGWIRERLGILISEDARLRFELKLTK